MSRYVAKRALSSHLEPEQLPQHIRADDGDVAGFQNADGGIGWYVNGPSDPEVTFKILLAAGDEYSKPRMRVYFAAAAEDSSADPIARAAAHAGLAVLDPSHTVKIREILAAGNVPFEEQLYYMAGLAAAGERQEARELYDGIVTPRQRTHGQEKWLEFSNLPKDYQRSAENRRVHHARVDHRLRAGAFRRGRLRLLFRAGPLADRLGAGVHDLRRQL